MLAGHSSMLMFRMQNIICYFQKESRDGQIPHQLTNLANHQKVDICMIWFRFPLNCKYDEIQVKTREKTSHGSIINFITLVISTLKPPVKYITYVFFKYNFGVCDLYLYVHVYLQCTLYNV